MSWISNAEVLKPPPCEIIHNVGLTQPFHGEFRCNARGDVRRARWSNGGVTSVVAGQGGGSDHRGDARPGNRLRDALRGGACTHRHTRRLGGRGGTPQCRNGVCGGGEQRVFRRLYDRGKSCIANRRDGAKLFRALDTRLLSLDHLAGDRSCGSGTSCRRCGSLCRCRRVARSCRGGSSMDQ